jgi:serine/threonine protein kinase
LVAWGYDYPYPDTPVPVLFMEAAFTTLTDFLRLENEHLLGDRPTDIKYHLALDVAAGLEVMHRFRIVHGDIKCDNVLIFKQDDLKLPFCAKLSDFGVCIDMEMPGSKFTIEDYRGTHAWLAPEVKNKDEMQLASFKPDIMLHIDSYSFGLVLLSIFALHGEPPALDKEAIGGGEEIMENAIQMLRSGDTIPSALRMQLIRAVRGLLAGDPWKRPLPNPELLRADIPAYADW